MMMYIIIGIACLVGIIVVVLLLPNSGKQQQKGQKYRFELSAGGGRKITFADPFDNFLVYGIIIGLAIIAAVIALINSKLKMSL